MGCGPPVAPPASRPAPAPGPSPRAAAPTNPSHAEETSASVEEVRLRADVTALAVVRPPLSPGHEKVRTHAAQTLRAAGFDVVEQDYGSGTNLIATLAGAQPEAIVVSAHYDHVSGCSGADDNASGVASVLELGRAVAGRRFERSLVLALWDEEEQGLIGSMTWAREAKEGGRDIVFAVSLDSVGYADDRPGTQRMPGGVNLLVPEVARSMEARQMRADFIAVVGDRGTEAFVEAFVRAGEAHELPVEHAVLNPLKKLAFGDAQRSDHASFWFHGYPAVFVTDTANFRYSGYHCSIGQDAPERLNYPFLTAVTRSLVDAVVALAKPR